MRGGLRRTHATASTAVATVIASRGGKARTGGYGHGQAIDITSEDGHAEVVWRWLDKHGSKYGLYRPMPGADPAHVQSRGNWHKLAMTLRESRARMVQEARAPAEQETAAR